MSLLTRVAQAQQTAQSRVSEPILLFDSVRPFLEEHPVVGAMRLEPLAVHKALIEYHRAMTGIQPPVEESVRPNKPDCPECKRGFWVIDQKEGFEVCDYCGLVHATKLNFLPDYDDDDTNAYRQQTGNVQGVSKWIVRHVQADGNEDVATLKRDMEHWNRYANIPTDELNDLAVNIRKCFSLTTERGTQSNNAKMAAAMIYRELRNKFPKEESVRSHVRSASLCHVLGKKESIERVTRTCRVAEFFCPNCNAAFHDRRSARWHCRGRGGSSLLTRPRHTRGLILKAGQTL